MTSNLGLNLNTNGFPTSFTSANLLGTNSLQPINADFENDILMPDYLKTSSPVFQAALQTHYQQTSQAQTAQNQNVQASPQSSIFTQENQNQVQQTQLPDITLPQNTNKKTNIFKTIGITLGVSAPVIAAYASKTALSLKNLAIKVPVLGIAGFALGSLIDQIVNANKTTV